MNNRALAVGRAGLSLVLALVARAAFRDEYGYLPLLGDLDLAIHEFGHILFHPFGETMTVLGGSLTQVAFPLVFVGYFALSRAHRDLYAATIGLWWTSINILSVAIYAADARAGVLPLLSGGTGQDGDAHDWNFLLAKWGYLGMDTIIADRMRRVAVVLCVASVLAGLIIALLQSVGASSRAEAVLTAE